MHISIALVYFDKSKCGIMNTPHQEPHAVISTPTFLPGDGWPWGSRGLTMQNDRHAVNHGAVRGARGDVGSNT